jgi:hypothetical protein
VRAGAGANVLLDAFGTLNMAGEYRALMQGSGCHVASFRPVTPSGVRAQTTAITVGSS